MNYPRLLLVYRHLLLINFGSHHSSSIILLMYYVYRWYNLFGLSGFCRSALLLDVIAASALVIYVTRVLLGYKQTRDRYQLLVNRTLYEKTVASGFGCIHFLIDASQQQQFKEAILVYAVLLKIEGGKVTSMRDIGDKCERFIYHVFQEKVEMPVDKAIETLVRLGLVLLKTVDEQIVLQAVPCSRAQAILQSLWNSLIG